MFTYRAIEDWTGLPSDGWSIERYVLREPPVRMPFRGTRTEAEAEAARLNMLAKQVMMDMFPRVPVPVASRSRARRVAVRSA